MQSSTAEVKLLLECIVLFATDCSRRENKILNPQQQPLNLETLSYITNSIKYTCTFIITHIKCLFFYFCFHALLVSKKKCSTD